MTVKSGGYIFDYGGTIDTCGCHWGRFIWHAYEECDVPVDWQQFRQAYIHAERTLGGNPVIKPHYTFRQTLSEKLRIEMEWLAGTGLWSVSHSELSGFHDMVLDMLYEKVVRETGRSRDVLLRLGADCKMVLVSNFYGNIHVVLKEFGLDGIFSGVIESAVVGIRKPDPRIFAMGVDALGMSAADVTVVGDSMDKDIIPAKSIGCRTVWISGDTWEETPQDSHCADKVIKSLEDLL